MSWHVNYVWNYCNETAAEQWARSRKFLSAFDLNLLTAGCSKELGLHSQTVQAVCEEHHKSRQQQKRSKLSWRSKKKSLGWVPFKASGVKVIGDTITYCGHVLRFWHSRPLAGPVRFGSFSQDASGHWYVSLVVMQEILDRKKTGREAGIDLGLKTLATLSDGTFFDRENITRKFEDRLAFVQRAKKKRLVTAIHGKIKNIRKDWNHKTTTVIAREYDKVVVGDVSSSKLIKTKMAKSVSDAGWSDFKIMLAYKAMGLGTIYQEVNESFSTVTCSTCKGRTGPKGLSELRVREWVCTSCNTAHQRDVNAAKNILQFSVRGI